MNLKKLLTDIQSVGLPIALQTVSQALHRDHLEQKYIHNPPDIIPLLPGFLLSTRLTARGIKLIFENAALDILFLTEDMVCLAWEPGHPPPAYALAKRDWSSVRFMHTTVGESHILQTSELSLTILADGGVIFADQAGSVYREELPPQRVGPSWEHQALLKPDSAIYGLGERAAPFNLRGSTYVMWNSDPGGSYGPGQDPLYMGIPVYMEMNAKSSYLVFYENPHPGYFALTETATAYFQGGLLRYFFVPGPPNRAISRYTELTGRPNLPPLWALGYHQSRWGYMTANEIEDIVAGFQQRDLPIQAIHLDIDYMDGFRVFTIHPGRFANFKQLTENLQRKGVKTVLILDPGVKKDTNYFLYQQGLKNKFFSKLPNGKPFFGLVWPGQAAFPDFTAPLTRQWWGEQYRLLLDLGVSGFWHDMNEPTSFCTWGDRRIPLPIQHDMDGQGGDHRQAHNLYGLLMASAGYEGIRSHVPLNRPWIFSRSGWAGIQRYAWNWTGDTDTSWASLQMTIPTILNLGLSGQPFSGPDIGGFSGDPDAELYTRWFQLATFLPLFRTHSAKGTLPREPWVYGEYTTAIIQTFLKLRRKLLPYLYSLAWEANQSGFPLVRPLYWPDLHDHNYFSINDEFLLGDALLIAPILSAGAQSRQVIFPPGNWYSLRDGSAFNAKNSPIEVQASLEQIPVFGRAGKILPLAEPDGGLTLSIFCPDPEQGVCEALSLYSDAGDGFPKTDADYRLDKFFIENTKDVLRISRQQEGEYPFPYQNIHLDFYGYNPKQIKTAPKEAAIEGSSLKSEIFNEIILSE